MDRFYYQNSVAGFLADAGGQTRLPEFYDGTYEYLKQIGIEETNKEFIS